MPWLVPHLLLPKTPTIIDLRVIDLVSSTVWREAETNIRGSISVATMGHGQDLTPLARVSKEFINFKQASVIHENFKERLIWFGYLMPKQSS